MIRSFIKAKRTLATCVLLAGLCIWTPAFAQLDYDTYDVYQGGALALPGRTSTAGNCGIGGSARDTGRR